jgi:diaminohydroxyphosphoribosylaminopyrimidine deaminase / 5-amino-6-(5-phosphoribosylamino)uracil reductase
VGLEAPRGLNMTLSSADYMARALFHAARGRGRTSPNPLVGAVVVSADGVVVGQGYHERAGDAHAEVRALDAAGVRSRGGTLYCTLEPCAHVGRTGPCVLRIVQAGISRVVAAVEDPNPLVRGQGFAFLRAQGVDVVVGVGEVGAKTLNQPFFTLIQQRRPFVVLKAAMSVDGCIAAVPGERTVLTSDAANRHAQRVRAEIDAIGVGVGTVIADDPLLTARGAYRARPLVRVVFDRSLRTPPEARLLSTQGAGPVMIVTTAPGSARTDARKRLEATGASVIVAPDATFRGSLTCLGESGISSLLLEGGAALHQAAWDEGAVDFVRLYVTPHALGADGLRLLNGRPFSPDDLFDSRREPLGPDVMIEGYVHRPR